MVRLLAASRLIRLMLFGLLAMVVLLMVVWFSSADAATTFTVNRSGDAKDRKLTGYRLAGDGSASKPLETRTESGIRAYCARCDGSHPKPDKGSGETFEDIHNRAIAP